MGSRLHLSRVRISDGEGQLYDESSDSRGITRSRWVRGALELMNDRAVSDADIDTAMGALNRLKRDSGGLRANLAGVGIYQELLDQCGAVASTYNLERSEWIRVALYLCASKGYFTVKACKAGRGTRSS